MYPSSTLCRTQEEFHRARAASTPLDNVRAIAEGAAAAWGHEAAAAEKREARGLRTRAIAERTCRANTRVPTARCAESGQTAAPRPASSSRTRNSCSGAVSSRGSGSPGAAARRNTHRQNACIVVTHGGLIVRFTAWATRLRNWLAERRGWV